MAGRCGPARKPRVSRSLCVCANRRAFSRYSINRKVEVFWDGTIFQAILLDISVGGAALEIGGGSSQRGLLLLLEPEAECCRPLYMSIVEQRPGTGGVFVRARFERLDVQDAAYLAGFIERWAEQIERSRLLSRMLGQRSA